jgi:VanZ family protein
MLIMLTNTTIKKLMPYLFWLLLAITTCLLLVELAPSSGGIPHADKAIHAFIFLSLSIAGYLSYPQHHTSIILGLTFYGALIEALQHLVTMTRHASLLDWFADLFGILLCFLIIRLLNRQTSI